MQTLRTFSQDNPNLLRTLGIAVVAAAAGGIGGVMLSKAVLAAKGTTVAHAVLAAKGGAAVKAGASSLPSLVQQGSATVGGAAKVLQPATSVTGLQSAVSWVNQAIASGTALSDKAMTLLGTLSRNALPLGTGAISGGVATVQVTKRRMRKIQGELKEQVTQTEAAQTEAERLQSGLTRAEDNLKELQSKLESLSTQRPSQQHPLVQIKGIGRVFAERLSAAGINTFAELAAQTPDAVRDIIGTTRGSAMFDPEEWIAEAQQRADPS